MGRKMLHAAGPPNSLEAYSMAFRNALDPGTHSNNQAAPEDEFLDPRLEQLQFAWARAAGDPERRAELEKEIGARQAELAAGA